MGELSNTKGLAAPKIKEGVEVSTSVRRIDNGYLIRESTYNNNTGECKSSEMYSKSGDPSKDQDAAGAGTGNALAETKKYLGGGR